MSKSNFMLCTGLNQNHILTIPWGSLSHILLVLVEHPHFDPPPIFQNVFILLDPPSLGNVGKHSDDGLLAAMAGEHFAFL